jgi:hypothetical protein
MVKTETKQKTETEQLFADLDKPSLVGLSYALRHPELWPPNFYWNYESCSQCAMGLAHALWRQSIPRANGLNGASIMANRFAMPFTDARNIFMGQGEWCPTQTIAEGRLWWKREITESDYRAVTPEMVADQIDAYLSRVV